MSKLPLGCIAYPVLGTDDRVHLAYERARLGPRPETIIMASLLRPTTTCQPMPPSHRGERLTSHPYAEADPNHVDPHPGASKYQAARSRTAVILSGPPCDRAKAISSLLLASTDDLEDKAAASSSSLRTPCRPSLQSRICVPADGLMR